MPGLGLNCILCLNFVLFCLSTSAQDLFEGDSCIANGGVEGQCVAIKSCPEVLAQLKKKRVFPVQCHWSSGVNIICCPTSTTTTTTTKRRPPPTTTPFTTRTNPPPTTEPTTGTKIQIRTSEKMCLKYANYVFWQTQDPTLLITDMGLVNASTCGMETETLIVGGETADPREFPHMVALGYGEIKNIAWQCGGILISEKFVLTAAHCLSARGSGNVAWARMGDLNLRSARDDADAVTMEVEEVIKHEGYKPPAHYNDIMLLKLKDEVTFTPHIRPACLYAEPGNPSGVRVTASGWGKNDSSSDSGTDKLMKVDLNLLAPEKCNKTLRQLVGTRQLLNGVTDDSMICAGYETNEKKDTCQGDSGGPLQIRLDTPYCMYGIIGLTSFGTAGCGIGASATVYTRVSNYIDWIESRVWP